MVAVVIPIVAVALIAAGLLFFWKKRKTKASKMKRKSEVEDYSYNPNAPVGGAAMGAMGVRGGEGGEAEMTEGTGGYRGWGSTTGGRGRKVSMLGSSVSSGQPLSPSTMGFSDAYLQPVAGGAIDGHGGMATSPTVSSFPSPSTDGNQSNAPLVRNRSDSSGHGVAVSQDGVHRGDSNASSNYSAMTRSDNSENALPPSPYEHRFSGQDGVYDEANNYSGQPYFGSPPIIRDVSARRNTQIQTPTSEHYPQQGNSGIAQNF